MSRQSRRCAACAPCRRRGRCRTGTSLRLHREPVGQPVLDRLRRDEVHRRRRGRRGRGAEHRARQHRLRRRDRRVRVAHRRPRDHAALDHRVRAHAEERRLPQHQVGELADLDRADLVVEAVRDRRADRVLGDVALGAVVVGARRRPAATPRRRFITCAVCQVRITTSPMRPIACASLPIIEIAPMSCSRSSAAMVDGRIRLSANARSSGTPGFRWWHTISMSRCSSRVLTVCGRVGLVELGSTLGCAGDGDDVGRVPAAGALGVVGVDRRGP